MKRLLQLAAVLALASGCYVGETDTEVRIASLREIQTDPAGTICADDLVGLVSLSYRTNQLSALGNVGSSVYLTYFLTNEAISQPVGFGQGDVGGTSHFDFLGRNVVLEYESTLGLASETLPVNIQVGEGQTSTTIGGCAQAPVLGPQAAAALGAQVLLDPITINIHTHIEGALRNGHLEHTDTVVMPITVLP